MAIYTTFFVCRPVDLLPGFPGWKLPTAEPRTRQIRNPFTGEVSTIETREPEWDEDNEAQEFVPEVVLIEGNYENYLENRIPALVRSSPHWAAKGLTTVELDVLLECMAVNGSLKSALYAPPSSGALLVKFPADFPSALKTVDLNTVARAWAEVMSSPDYTHSVDGEKLYDGWDHEDSFEILKSIASIARSAKDEERLFLLIET